MMKQIKIMKNLMNGCLLFACSLVLISASCKKEKIGIDGLPPATQEGKGTFGCLVNGLLFTPKGSPFGGPIQQSYYQFVNGAYHFLVAAGHSNNGKTLGVQINAEDIVLQTGMTIPLVEGKKGEAIGWHFDYGNDLKDYKTNNQIKGELKITRFDEVNQIVSGIFWFDAVNAAGEKVEIREGRFDMRFIK